jgi:hypothetical protein
VQHLFRLTLLSAPLCLALPAGQAQDSPGKSDWQPLFNGKDLTGWKTHPNPNPGEYQKVVPVKSDAGAVVGYSGETKDGKLIPLWQVKDGLLIGSGPHSHLFTERGDFENFQYRVEVKINDKGNSGQYFRAKLAPGFPPGYEAQINATHGDQIRSGSLYPDGRTKLGNFRKDITVMKTAPHGPDEWFVQEVIADGPHIRILVNGKQTVDFTDPNKTFTKGHFALQGHDPGTVVTFKKVEWKPLTK